MNFYHCCVEVPPQCNLARPILWAALVYFICDFFPYPRPSTNRKYPLFMKRHSLSRTDMFSLTMALREIWINHNHTRTIAQNHAAVDHYCRGFSSLLTELVGYSHSSRNRWYLLFLFSWTLILDFILYCTSISSLVSRKRKLPTPAPSPLILRHHQNSEYQPYSVVYTVYQVSLRL